MQPGEAIFLLNYEDICFVMKDWPRPGTSSRPGPSRSRSRSPVPVPVSRVRHSTFSHCVILAQRATAGVAPVLFFLFFRCVSFCFVSHCSSAPCYGFVALLFLATRTTAVAVWCVFNLVPQAAANRESSTLPSSGAYQMHCACLCCLGCRLRCK